MWTTALNELNRFFGRMFRIIVLLENPTITHLSAGTGEEILGENCAVELTIHVLGEHEVIDGAIRRHRPPKMDFVRMFWHGFFQTALPFLLEGKESVPEHLETGFIGENNFGPVLISMRYCPF